MNDTEKTEKLIAACWSMYTAIQMIARDGICRADINKLEETALDAMIYAGQIRKEVPENE